MLCASVYRSRPYRLGPVRRISAGGCMSRVSEDARNCVVFLGYDRANPDDPAEIEPEGTGFLFHCGEGGYRGVYIVTAWNVAKNLGSDPFVVRQNDAAGTARLHHVDNAVWYRHPDRS